MKRVNTFVDMDTKLVGGSEVREEGSETREESSSKRGGDELEQEPLKKQKMEDDKETPELQNAEISFDREDLETLWKLVKAKHGYTRPEEGYERVLSLVEVRCGLECGWRGLYGVLWLGVSGPVCASPKTPPGSPPHQPPPPLPPAGSSGNLGASGASRSSSKTAASAEYTAWTTTDTRLKPSILSIPKELHMDDDTTPDEQVQSSGDEDIGHDHIPTMNLRHNWWTPLTEDRPATLEPAWFIPSSDLPALVHNWASAIASTYAPPLENSLLA
ncbi:hypothetical protein Tco_1475960 [Tanacetum coccineum]